MSERVNLKDFLGFALYSANHEISVVMIRS